MLEQIWQSIPHKLCTVYRIRVHWMITDVIEYHLDFYPVISETKESRNDKGCPWQASAVLLFGVNSAFGRRTVILSSHCLSCFLPVFLLGGGRADKSCFDAGAVRGLAREDSKHCLCRTFKINPSATGLVPPPPHPTSHPLSLFPEPFFLFFSLPSL